MVVQAPGVGEYYGIEGMNWLHPPILERADATRTVGGRSYSLYFDGAHLRLVAFRASNAVYWVSNTLTRSLSNKQMLAIPQSMRPRERANLPFRASMSEREPIGLIGTGYVVLVPAAGFAEL